MKLQKTQVSRKYEMKCNETVWKQRDNITITLVFFSYHYIIKMN